MTGTPPGWTNRQIVRAEDNYAPRLAQEYVFNEIVQCNMCGAPVSHAKVLGRRLSTSQGLRPTRRVGVSTTVMRCRRMWPRLREPAANAARHRPALRDPPEDYWKPEYFERDPDYFRRQIDTFRRQWGGDGQPVALDIGAGIGKCMTSLTAHGFEAHGLEPSAAFRQAAIDRGGIDPDRLMLGAVETATYDRGRSTSQVSA